MSDLAADGQPVWQLYRPAQRWGYLAILFLVCLSNYVDRHVMAVLLQPIKTEFGASDTAMGVLNGFAFAATYAVLGLPIARWADRGDRRVVITASLAVWSVAAAACGFARSFPALMLARLGVGVGEAGAIPPAQSLIADYFPPDQRTRAIAVFMAAASIGYIVAFVGGAGIAAAYGWRWAFVALAGPGLLLCMLTFFGLDEPRRRLAATQEAGERLGDALRSLAAKRTYVLTVTAMVLYFLVAYGALTWVPAYLQRVMGLDLVHVGTLYGFASMGSTLIGSLGGGWLTDRLSRRGDEAFARVPGTILIFAWPAYMLMMTSERIELFLALSFVGGLALGAAVPAMFSVLHLVCGSTRRSMAVAVAFFFANLLGLGFGPLITGALSDAFTAAYGPVGLRYALMIAFTILIPSGLVLRAAAKHIRHDREA